MRPAVAASVQYAWAADFFPPSTCMTLRSFILLSATIAVCTARPLPATGPNSAARPDRACAATRKLPLEWGPDKNVVWKQAIPGLGWSSPVVVAGRIYLTTAVPAAGKGNGRRCASSASTPRAARALERRGVPRARPRRRRGHTKNSHASPTPIVADGKLYVHFGHMGTACLDLDGKVLWTQTGVNTARSTATAARRSSWTTCSSSACDGGDKQFVVALDAATGKVPWKTDRNGTGRQEVLVQHAAGDRR